MSETEQSFAGLADTLLKDTNEVMRHAKMEEELRIGFEKALDPVLKKIGITSSKYERGNNVREYKGKHPDAVHGKVIIEYEPPASFRKKGVIEHAADQLRDYLSAESYVRGEAVTTLFERPLGVGFDGERIFFVRFRDEPNIKGDAFVIEGPYTFDVESARTFLMHLRGLSRRPLTPENLAEAFGPESALAPKVVTALANALEYWGKERPRVFFNEWKRLFGIVYGEHFESGKEEEAKALSSQYGVGKDTDFQELLFSVHTYFAYLMKLIAVEILSISEIAFEDSFSARLTHLRQDEFKAALEDIENGGVYMRRGISNFLEGDFFRWYLDAMSPELCDALREVARNLSQFEPATTALHPRAARDLLKRLYQYLVPQPIRHKLGEYYTPDWLAELVIDETGYKGQFDDRVLDPACGSGTFLVLAIQRAKQRAKEQKIPAREIGEMLLRNIYGFDLNPLAVIASRTNYLFALGDLVSSLKHIEIPVYLADSVLSPLETGSKGNAMRSIEGDFYAMKTSVAEFHIPAHWIAIKGLQMERAAATIEELVKRQEEPAQAMKRMHKDGLVMPGTEMAVNLFYEQILDLEKQGKNGIWARFLKNAFAPSLAGQFDFIIGNPPWIRWDYLSREYREATLELWKKYGLFSLKGFAARLGGGKKDLAMLFVYASVDRFLKKGGKLGFLITQELFKAKGAGEGFRRFCIGEKETFKVFKAHDLADVQPFEGATNKTAAIFIQRTGKTAYPVPYILWKRKKGAGRVPTDASSEIAMHMLTKKAMQATPIAGGSSAWQTLEKGHEGFAGVQGANAYKAILGANPNPYGVFWLGIKDRLADGRVLVRNLPEMGKQSIPAVEARLEPDLIFPAIRGSDLSRWHAVPEIYMLVVQDPKTRSGHLEDHLKNEYPDTYTYLTKFKSVLLERALYKKYHAHLKNPFYSQFNISEETFAPYRVVWKAMSNDVYGAVVSQYKTPFGFKCGIPLHTTAFIPYDNEDEAHYLCAIINSSTVRDFIKSYSSAGRGFGTPSVMQHVGIPKYDPKNALHVKLSGLSKELHGLVSAGENQSEIGKKEKEVNALVTDLFSNIAT